MILRIARKTNNRIEKDVFIADNKEAFPDREQLKQMNSCGYIFYVDGIPTAITQLLRLIGSS